MSDDVRESASAAVHFAMLALLEGRELTGYEILAQFERTVGDAWILNSGQVYSTLQRLVRDRMIVSRPAAPEGSGAGRPRARYRLLPAGEKVLRAWRTYPETAPAPVRDILFLRLLFTPPEHLPALRDHLARELVRAEHQLTELPHAQAVTTWAVQRRHLVAAGTRFHVAARRDWLTLVLGALDGVVGIGEGERKAARS